LGKHLRRTGNVSAAITHLRAAVRIMPDSAEATEELSAALGEEGAKRPER
jgi:Flp pilus assembly protein TadD